MTNYNYCSKGHWLGFLNFFQPWKKRKTLLFLWTKPALMTNQRSNYLYHFLGTIQKKYRERRPKKNPQYFYQLKVKLSEQYRLQKIFVFKPKLTKPEIWNSLESDSYAGKKYLFHCRNYQGSYYLLDWEEVNENTK